MAIRFKFRSSPIFDTLEIGQQSSISIRDLKSKIILMKHLNLRHDFDLVFSDSLSGTEFTDGNTQIASGSSVIIKRVPAKSSSSLRESGVSAGHVGSRDADYVNVLESPVLDFGENDCDDFTNELCPLPDDNLSKLTFNTNEEKDSFFRRRSEKLPSKGEKLEAIPPTQCNPKESSADEGSISEVQPESIPKEQTKFDRTVAEKQPDLEGCDMPSELKCSLCTTYFKEAVMIPCCQYSFCEKCIRLALVKNSRCPMCFSTKCKPENLLPNLALRQTINRFLESQLHYVLEKNLDRYAPDGESGIQMKELSYAAIVPPRDLQLNRSATKVSAKLMGNTKCNPAAIENCTEFEGENEPLNMAGKNEEVTNSCMKKGQGFRRVTGGGERNFINPCRLNKGFRTCYMCGSPDHLIRECPTAASSHSGNWNGNVPCQGIVPAYAPQYWPGYPPPSGVLYNMFYGPEMMLYKTNMAAATPSGLSPYVSPMFSGYPVTSGTFTLGGMACPSGINVHQMGQSDLLGLRGCVKQQGRCTEAFEREKVLDWDRNAGRQPVKAEIAPNDSGDNFAKRSEGSHRSHGHSDDDDKYSYVKKQERIIHSSEGNLRNARLNRTTLERAVPDSRIRPPVSRRNEELRAESGSGSSRNRHYSSKDSIKRRKTEHKRRSDRDVYSHSESGLEPSYSSSDGRRRRDKSGHNRFSDNNLKPSGKDIYYVRGRTIRYSDDDYQEDYQSHKRKRYR